MSKNITIAGRQIGPGCPAYIIAEMSANHGQSYDRAVEIIHAMKDSGADAVKLQTYTPDTITIPSDRPEFKIGKGTLWEGKNLHQLYGEAYTPWDWQPKLKKVADDLGMHLFSTPFDFTAVDFLEKMNVPAYKIASFELPDVHLIKKAAATGKPLIMSTGMATLEEIQDAVDAARSAGNDQIALLKCTSAYPALPEEMNLETIPDIAKRFGTLVGLSDHTLGTTVPVAAVTLGACIIEKHFTMSRSEPGPDSAFSLEPAEFKQMVDAIRITEKALGKPNYTVTPKEEASRVFRRSLFVVENMKAGDVFTDKNVRSIRPGYGLAPKHLDAILGKKAAKPIERGTPLQWDLIV
jgi:N-acetylneuraminate synthase